jgi:SIR2-like domain
MDNKTRMEEIFEMVQTGENKELDPRESMLQNISRGSVIPVISSSFRIEQIFHELAKEVGPNVVEGLIALWAKFIKYPMSDSSNLARVAQYYFVDRNDDLNARTGIFSFLNKFLWNMANTEVKDPALAAGLRGRMEAMRFSDLVKELDYPKFPQGTEDPLRLLARFPLRYYITTSQSDFVERALVAEGKKPRTQICYWSGEMANIREEHRPITKEFNVSSTTPVVYHLYGLEEYPQTLVLSEDDYINFLISIGGDTDTAHPKIPLYLRGAVGESQLILIGFRLSDWDFRVLFRLMMNYRTGLSPRGMLIQLQEKENANAIEYLKSYYGRKSFDIEWSDAERFVQELWNDWDRFR